MKICARATAVLLFTFCFLSLTQANSQAQVYELQPQQFENGLPKPNISGDDDAADKPGGYIRDFLEKRSGERGVGGFMMWMLSSQKWIDLFRYFTGQLVSIQSFGISR